jgi:SAM-dependent methyltransferase
LASLNPAHAFLWTFRRSGRDVINLYNSLSPVMQLATGGDMLNFGYWESASEPVAAQSALCSLAGEMAELASAKRLVDVGSGLSAPATQWRSAYGIDINCVNINYGQLLAPAPPGISRVNATSTLLPFAGCSADRVIALESAQHFRPLAGFVRESRRILKDSGLLVMALPVVAAHVRHAMLRLGILSLTWSSEHYGLDYVKSAIAAGGFEVKDVALVGRQVYEPLADYYIANRPVLRQKILRQYPAFLENVLYRSMLKMRQVSRDGTIDYAVIKAA